MSNGVEEPDPVPGVTDPGKGGCMQLGPLPAINGRTATLVILQSSGSCHDVTRNHTGVVFFDAEPVACTCLSDDEISAFEAWGAAMFSSVRILTVSSPLAQINCPPPQAVDPELTAMRDALRGELRRLGPGWIAQAIPAKPAA